MHTHRVYVYVYYKKKKVKCLVVPKPFYYKCTKKAFFLGIISNLNSRGLFVKRKKNSRGLEMLKKGLNVRKPIFEVEYKPKI